MDCLLTCMNPEAKHTCIIRLNVITHISKFSLVIIPNYREVFLNQSKYKLLGHGPVVPRVNFQLLNFLLCFYAFLHISLLRSTFRLDLTTIKSQYMYICHYLLIKLSSIEKWVISIFASLLSNLLEVRTS